MSDFAERDAEKRNQKPLLRRQKGWKGFVHGYKDRREIFDKVWHTIDWNKDPEESGAKAVVIDKDHGKTIYTF